MQAIVVDSSSDDEDYEEEVKPLKTITNNAKTRSNPTKAQPKKAAAGGMFSSLKGLVGAKVLTQEMIEPVMEKMQEHLIGKLIYEIFIF